MRKALAHLWPFALGLTCFALGVLASRYGGAERVPVVSLPPPTERNVHIDYPEPSSPTGRATARLVIRRVTGGPEGVAEYDPPVPTKKGAGGALENVVGPEDWVISIGPRSYFMSLRD